MVTPINNNKMNKYNFMIAHSNYELKNVLMWIEEKKYKLISATSINNCIYVFYDQEII